MDGLASPQSVGDALELVRSIGAPAEGDFVILCDHASNEVPPGFGALGLTAADMRRHIAWDPGALPVAARLARRLGCPLLFPAASRLIIDCNRPTDSAQSCAEISEDTEIPGNRDLSAALRAHRIADIYDAYHAAIDALLDTRARASAMTAVVAVHSFTPVFRRAPRPWHVGVLSGSDLRLATELSKRLRTDPALVVGDNEPYGPWDGVYHTLHRHAEARGLPCVMIEIRNDLIADEPGQAAWADRLAVALGAALADRRQAWSR